MKPKHFPVSRILAGVIEETISRDPPLWRHWHIDQTTRTRKIHTSRREKYVLIEQQIDKCIHSLVGFTLLLKLPNYLYLPHIWRYLSNENRTYKHKYLQLGQKITEDNTVISRWRQPYLSVQLSRATRLRKKTARICGHKFPVVYCSTFQGALLLLIAIYN